MKYKVGDKVIIRRDCLSTLDSHHAYKDIYFNDDMEKFMGKVGTILDIRKRENGVIIYKVDTGELDDYVWSYVEEWLQPYGNKGGKLL